MSWLVAFYIHEKSSSSVKFGGINELTVKFVKYFLTFTQARRLSPHLWL